MRCGVEVLSFSAHADYEQTAGFLDALRPRHVVLVHGEAGEMLRLKQALEKAAPAGTRSVHNPRLATPVRLWWTAEWGTA